MHITINSPSSLNALCTEMLIELEQIFDTIPPSIKVITITGVDRSFVAGADISEMASFSKVEAKKYAQLGCRVFQKIESSECIVIAMINGYALGGGCELALACDLRIASEKAKFSQPELTLGIIPGFYGTQRLSRIVGISKAKELIYTGKMISAEDALAIGLVNKVLSHDLLNSETALLVETILKQPIFALKQAKRSIQSLWNYSVNENELFSECFNTEEQKIRMKKFLNKNKGN